MILYIYRFLYVFVYTYMHTHTHALDGIFRAIKYIINKKKKKRRELVLSTPRPFI